MLLVGGASRTIARHPEVGCLVQPRAWASLDRIADSGRPWAADNDCFQRLDVDAYWRMITRIARVDRSRLLWVACPDVVGDAQATVNRWVRVVSPARLPGVARRVRGSGRDRGHSRSNPVGSDVRFIRRRIRPVETKPLRRKPRAGSQATGKVAARRQGQQPPPNPPLPGDGSGLIDGRSYSAWPDRRMPEGLKMDSPVEGTGHAVLTPRGPAR